MAKIRYQDLLSIRVCYTEEDIFYRNFTLLSILVLSALLLQSCAPADSESTETQVSTLEPIIEPSPTILPSPTEETENEFIGQVSFWHSFEENEMDSLSAVIENFQEEHPQVEFDILYVPRYDLLNKYESSARNGGGPCILVGAFDWGPPLFGSDLIKDISGLTSDEFLTTINPVALGSLQYSGALVGLPLNTTGVVPFRNKSIIPVAPSTIDEMINFSQESTSGDVVGAYLDYGLFFSGGHLDGVGGQLMDSEGNPAFNNDKGIEWLELIQRFEEAGPVENNNDNDVNLFLQDKAGIVIAGLWNASSFAEAIGSDNLAIDPWPSPLSGYVQTENLYLNTNSTETELEICWSFVEFLLTEESQEIFADPSMAGFIPPIIGISLSDPLQMQVMETFGGGAVFPVILEMNVYWDPVNNALLSVMEQGADPADALQIAHDIVVAELESLRGE